MDVTLGLLVFQLVVALSLIQHKVSDKVYCERPSIEKFVSLVEARQLVFELIMHELDGGRVRNHGYPWRLVNEDFLTDLFSLQVKVR